MSFKSSIPWPARPANLPTYEGGSPGKAAVRKAEMQAGGMDGIRRVDWKDGQGNTYTMNTRNGMPEVVCTPAITLANPLSSTRGFIANILGSGESTLFSPYTLVPSNLHYTPATTRYSVLPLATVYNVPVTDTTKWMDVLSIVGSSVMVNGKTLPAITAATSGVPSFPAVPWIIPDLTGVEAGKYGTAIERRVFAVGDYSVYSWAGGGVTSSLSGSTARMERKALVCGVALDESTHTAKMSQLWFIGESWQSISSMWFVTSAQISMLLTPPYLQKVGGTMASEQLAPPMVFVGGVVGTDTEGAVLPGGQICIVGTAELGSHFGENQTTEYQQITLPWTEIATHDFEGERRYTTDTSTLIGELNETYPAASGVVCEEVTVSVSAFSKTVGRQERLWWLGANVDLPPIQASSYSQTGTYDPITGTVSWDVPPGNIIPRGASAFETTEGMLGNLASSRVHESKGTFQVSVSGNDLIKGEYRRNALNGTQVNSSPGAKYDSTLANPYGNIGSSGGLGLFSSFSVSATCYSGDLSGRAAAINAKAATFLGGKVYDTARANSENLFLGSVGPRLGQDDSLLSWVTTDYILYDDANATYISVVATFSGEQHFGANATATLAVKLVIKAPSGEATLDLFTSSFGYGEMLPELTDSNNMVFIPSPRISVMFTPMFREQGMFPGAAYTTAAEVAAGAVQACLFNFVLKLGTFGDIGEDQSNGVVRFIPCNLLEMLYAYVFSTSYGRDEYDRYPVTFLSRFNNINNTLFSQQWRVHYRDGVLTDWLDTLGGAYITETSTELSRI